MKVTIGLPVFNSATHVVDAIKSIKAQTFDDWECLIVNDGSTDNSMEVIQSHIDERFRVISDGQNLGLVKRLNQIASLSRGEYIARMDSDDIMHPDRIRLQVEELDKHPEIDVVSTLKYSIDDQNYVYGSSGSCDITDLDYKILKYGFVVHASILCRRRWALEHRYSNEYGRAEDRELWARGISHRNLKVIPLPLYYYREIGNLSLYKYRSSYYGDLRVILKYGVAKVGVLRTSFLLIRWAVRYILVHLIFALNFQSLLRSRESTMNAAESLENTVYLNRFLAKY